MDWMNYPSVVALGVNAALKTETLNATILLAPNSTVKVEFDVSSTLIG
jgi:hypothetical protein